MLSVADSPVMAVRLVAKDTSAEPEFFLTNSIRSTVLESLRKEMEKYQCDLAMSEAVNEPKDQKTSNRWTTVYLEYTVTRSKRYVQKGTNNAVFARSINASISLYPPGSNTASITTDIAADPDESMMMRGTGASQMDDRLTENLKERFQAELDRSLRTNLPKYP